MGEKILGTDFSFDIEIRLGAGAFVCGEETALIASTEGGRGMPKPRPPFPAVKGLWDKPTVINNVETYASIPVIFMKGGDWYAKIGTETSKGTKVFALTGKIKNSGSSKCRWAPRCAISSLASAVASRAVRSSRRCRRVVHRAA
jgi:NADH:ubiquinone oxidoreductase subunit F (NADH-binding)